MDEETGDRLDSNGKVIENMLQFCTTIGIQKNTFKKYVHGNQKKRRRTTNGVRKRPHFSKRGQKFMADTIALQDRSNDGLTPSAMINRLQDLQPEVTRTQTKNYLHRTLKNHHIDVSL